MDLLACLLDMLTILVVLSGLTELSDPTCLQHTFQQTYVTQPGCSLSFA